MRQKFLNAIDRVIRQAEHYIGEPLDGVHLVEFAAGEEAIKMAARCALREIRQRDNCGVPAMGRIRFSVELVSISSRPSLR